MALHDTTSYAIITGDTSPSLPDPTTVSGRYHKLVNSDGATVSWTSSGGPTPFLVNGASAASVSVPRGGFQLLYSNGTQWVAVAAQSGVKRIVAATGVTNASGQVTVAFSPAFTATPVVTANVQVGAATNGSWCEVRALSASSVTIQVWSGRGVLIGGQTTTEAGAGLTVHVQAMDAG